MLKRTKKTDMWKHLSWNSATAHVTEQRTQYMLSIHGSLCLWCWKEKGFFGCSCWLENERVIYLYSVQMTELLKETWPTYSRLMQGEMGARERRGEYVWRQKEREIRTSMLKREIGTEKKERHRHAVGDKVKEKMKMYSPVDRLIRNDFSILCCSASNVWH